MLIRPLAGEDLEAALDLFEEVAAEGLWLATEAPVDRRETRARWEALASTGEGTILVAEEDGAPVGLAALAGRETPELGLLVAASSRRRGVGRALLEAAIAQARTARARAIVLHVFPHATAALALYRDAGFAETGVARAAFLRRSGERWDAIRMELRLR